MSPSARFQIEPTGNRFGTFGGVFTPSILTIFGVIMFMRAGSVTGSAGVWHALLILLIAKTITSLTAVSISAISTNTIVRGGGAYYLISRVLGPEFGGTIGVALFLAQSLSVPFYILGFTEALTQTFSSLVPYALYINLSTAAFLFLLTWIGASWAIRAQYVIMAVMGLSILAFLGGGMLLFNTTTLAENMGPAPDVHFWSIFAIYFPAVTGIMAGVNMSGDLKDPGRSIPAGTFAAILVGALVYGLQIVVMGGAFGREELIASPYGVLANNALFGAWFLVAAGVWCATLSSAIGSFMGAPRILQALSRDDLFSTLKPFAVGAPDTDEPRRALGVTLVITVAVMLIAGGGGGGAGGAFDMVATVVTMFFLFTYGMTNLAAFVESFGSNPSFRPRYRAYHWSMALLGAVGCTGAAILIDPVAAIVAILMILGLYMYIRRKMLDVAFGDARRGFVYARVRRALLDLSRMRMHPKNWRPTIVVLSGNPQTRLTLVTYSAWLEGRRGILSLAEILVGTTENLLDRRQAAQERLEAFVRDNGFHAFAEAVAVADFDSGVSVFLQSHSIGPIKPNIVMLGWSADPARAEAYVGHLSTIARLKRSVVALADQGLPEGPKERWRIDLWWRGQQNGALMTVLAYMLKTNPDWKRAELRILRMVESEAGVAPATAALQELISSARVEGTPRVVLADAPFLDILHRESGNATVVLLGLAIPDVSEASEFHARTQAMLEGLPTTLLICSSGEADLTA